MTAAFDINNTAPFASFVVAESSNSYVNQSELLNCLKSVVSDCIGNVKAVEDLTPPSISGIDKIYAFYITEERIAAWSGLNKLSDNLNHLVACFIHGDFVAIYASDSVIKSGIHDALLANKLSGWSAVDEELLIHAYVSGKSLKTLWLGGTHRKITIKPNSKIMSGESLGDAIDPFSDSTFVAGAVRSSAAGVSLKRSSVWFGPKQTWMDFCTSAQKLLNELIAAKASPTVFNAVIHHGLARTIRKLQNLGVAYHVEWAAPETLEGTHRPKKLAELRAEYDIEISPMGVASPEVMMKITHKMTNTTTDLLIKPNINKGRISFSIPDVISKPFIKFEKLVKSDAEFIRVFYDSGQTITNASLCHASVQDREFTFFFADFLPVGGVKYDITKEKPKGNPPPLDDMFTALDDSLFKWVFKEGLEQLGLPQPSPKLCWIYCDDRPGEIADFIHFHNPVGGIPKITLIHVKGSDSDTNRRQVCPGPYELVTAQAMKNIRRVLANNILEAVNSSLSASVSNRVWDKKWGVGLRSGINTKNEMVAALNSLTSRCEYEIIVVQPHVLHSKYFISGTQSGTIGAVQLRSLLFGAQAMARGASATFRVVADKR